MDGCVGERTNGCVGEWTNGCVGGWMKCCPRLSMLSTKLCPIISLYEGDVSCNYPGGIYTTL